MENNQNVPGKGAAVASLVLGIIAVVLWFFGYTSIVSVILGIVGLVCAGNAKKAGFMGGLRTAGFVLSLIGLIGGGIAFVACVACAGAIGAAGMLLLIKRTAYAKAIRCAAAAQRIVFMELYAALYYYFCTPCGYVRCDGCFGNRAGGSVSAQGGKALSGDSG